MNYLAHVLLSGQDPSWQLGGFLGDFIKGPLPDLLQIDSSQTVPDHLIDAQGEPWATPILHGVKLHRRIDVFTDADTDYRRCLALLGPECRRFGGIALDVFVDHVLSRHWDRFHTQSLDVFSDNFYCLCETHRASLPVNAGRFMQSVAEHHLFAGYGRWEVFEQVLIRIDQRIRFESNVAEAGREIQKRYELLESILLPFIAKAQQQSLVWREASTV